MEISYWIVLSQWAGREGPEWCIQKVFFTKKICGWTGDGKEGFEVHHSRPLHPTIRPLPAVDDDIHQTISKVYSRLGMGGRMRVNRSAKESWDQGSYATPYIHRNILMGCRYIRRDCLVNIIIINKWAVKRSGTMPLFPNRSRQRHKSFCGLISRTDTHPNLERHPVKYDSKYSLPSCTNLSPWEFQNPSIILIRGSFTEYHMYISLLEFCRKPRI